MGRWKRLQSLPCPCHNVTVIHMCMFIIFSYLVRFNVLCVFTSFRFNSPKNLQLCFINNSESEEEDDEGASSKEVGAESRFNRFSELYLRSWFMRLRKALGFCYSQSSCEAELRGSCSRGLKQEVKAALRTLRDKLWAEQKEKEVRGFKDIVHSAVLHDCLSSVKHKRRMRLGGLCMHLQNKNSACNGTEAFKFQNWFKNNIKVSFKISTFVFHRIKFHRIM